MTDPQAEAKLQKKDRSQSRYKNPLKHIKFPSTKSRHDEQVTAPLDPDRPTPPPKTGVLGRANSVSKHGRQPPQQTTIPPAQEDPLEQVRKEGEVLERGLSKENVNGVYPESSPSRPSFQNASNTEKAALPHQTTNQILNSATYPAVLAMTQPPSQSMGSQPLYPAGEYQISYTNGAKVATPEEGHFETAYEYPTSLDPGRKDEIARANTFPSLYEQAQAQKEALEEEKKRLEDELVHARGEVAEVSATVRSQQRTIQEKDAAMRRLQDDMNVIQTTNAQREQDVEQLRGQNSDLQADLQHHKMNLNAVNKELRQLRSELKSSLDNDFFIAQWDDLHRKIQNVTNQYFVGHASRSIGSMVSRGKGARVDKSDMHPSRRLTYLTKKHAQYNNSDTHRPLLIQAFIWWTLTNKVFDHGSRTTGGLYWAGDVREIFGYLQTELQPVPKSEIRQRDPNQMKRFEADARNFHKWRSTTCMMLLAKQPAKNRIQRHDVIYFVEDIADAITPFAIINKETERARALDDIRAQLYAIIFAAMDLDAEIHKQLASIRCEQWTLPNAQGNPGPLYGFMWDEREMEMILGPEQAKGGRMQFEEPHVELIVQPALLREGNQYGEKYSVTQVLCKAKVVVGDR